MRMKTLEYTCPSHGGWGMVRSGMLVPESIQLFVSPPACGRHGALGAVRQGFKNRLYYLCLEESDIVSGYENAIEEAVAEVLERRKERPKVMLIFVSCLDDLIGTDGDAVIESLSERFSDVRFRMCHMNPLSNDSETPPLVTLWKSVYSLMERQDKERRPMINLIGSYRPVDRESEFFTFLRYMGIEDACHIGNCKTYETFRDMGNNCLNLIVAPSAQKAAEQLRMEQGIEELLLPVTYDPGRTQKNYKALWNKLVELGFNSEDMEQQAADLVIRSQKKAKEAVAMAKEKTGGRPICLDDSAFAAPFAAARFLYEQGFMVEDVYVSEWEETDTDYQWLLQNTKVQIRNARAYTMVDDWKKDSDTVAFGLEAAYISGSRYVVPLFQDEGMYGFFATEKLMDMLSRAMEQPADLPALIEQSGFVV